MYRKKAQAAMEFLMTYGWAILVVLVAIGALAYFGVLSPDQFLPERCQGTSGLDCLDKASISSDANTVSFAMKNNVGFRINITHAPSADEDCATISSATASVEGATPVAIGSGGVNATLANGEQAVITITCSGIDSGRFKSKVDVPYVNLDTGLAHEATYSITGIAS